MKVKTKRVIIEFLIILIIIFIISLVLSFIRRFYIADVNQNGFPLIYREVGTMPPPPGYPEATPNFYPLKLIIDILIWGSIALGITYWRYKIRKKR